MPENSTFNMSTFRGSLRGDLAYNIVCGGTLNSWDNCYTKAGKICKEKGYEILKQDEGQYDIPLNPGQRGVNRNLIIRCKK